MLGLPTALKTGMVGFLLTLMVISIQWQWL